MNNKYLLLKEIEDYELFLLKVNRLIKRSEFSKEKMYLLLLRFFPELELELLLDTLMELLVNFFRSTDPICKFSSSAYAVATSTSIPIGNFESRLKSQKEKYSLENFNFIVSYAISPYESTNFLNLLKVAYNRMVERRNELEEKIDIKLEVPGIA